MLTIFYFNFAVEKVNYKLDNRDYYHLMMMSVNSTGN